MNRPPPRTLLDKLLQESDYTLEEWCRRFSQLAAELGEDATLSVRQLQRWASGQITDARPAARRVAARLWAHPFSTLVSPVRNPATVRPHDLEPLLGHLAMEMTLRRVTRLHDSEVRDDLALLADPDRAQLSVVLRTDRDGMWSFIHDSLIDLFVARHLFGELAAGRSAELATTQTTHVVDGLIKDFLAEDRDTTVALRAWLHGSSDSIVRVNSAGILAKLNDPIVGDDVIRALKRDPAVHDLYLTAVLARVLSLSWDAATDLATILTDERTARESGASDFANRAAFALAREVAHGADVSARWLCASTLATTGARPPGVVDTLCTALVREDSLETRQVLVDVVGQGSGGSG